MSFYDFFAIKKVSVDNFKAAPYMLMLVLHKDVLFHYLGIWWLPDKQVLKHRNLEEILGHIFTNIFRILSFRARTSFIRLFYNRNLQIFEVFLYLASLSSPV